MISYNTFPYTIQVDCKWGKWQIGGKKKCSNGCKGKRHDVRDQVQGAKYGGKQCNGHHERICECCSENNLECSGNRYTIKCILVIPKIN